MDQRAEAAAIESRTRASAPSPGVPPGGPGVRDEDVRSALERDMMSLPEEVGLRGDYGFVTEWQEEPRREAFSSAVGVLSVAR